MMYTYCHPLSLPHALPVSAAYARTMWRPGAAGAEHLVHPAVPGAPVGPGSDQVQARSLQATSCRHRVADSVEHGSEARRSEEHTSELQSLMRISYAVFSLKKKTKITIHEQSYALQQ